MKSKDKQLQQGSLVLDIDGTLINTLFLHYLTTKIFIRKYFGKDFSLNEYKKYFGLKAEEIIKKLTNSNDEYRIKKLVIERAKLIEKLLKRKWNELVKLNLIKPEDVKYINLLRKKYKIGIFTSAKPNVAKIFLRKLKIKYDYAVFGNIKHGKPNPMGLYLIEKNIGKVKCFVGDTYHDYLTAKNYKTKFIVFDREWNKNIDSIRIKSFKDLVKICYKDNSC